MAEQHPITPPPEVVQQLADGPGTWLEKIINAYRAGADQELEAVLELLREDQWGMSCTLKEMIAQLRAARRPKPPSLKEQGRQALEGIANAVVMATGGAELDVLKIIVESLPD